MVSLMGRFLRLGPIEACLLASWWLCGTAAWADPMYYSATDLGPAGPSGFPQRAEPSRPKRQLSRRP